jgi:hypothetical protein
LPGLSGVPFFAIVAATLGLSVLGFGIIAADKKDPMGLSSSWVAMAIEKWFSAW